MQLVLTEDAADLVRQRGGRVAIDFIPPIA
jgi:hypothetical protein